MGKRPFAINVIANWVTTGYGMSGGDRIFIECARKWEEEGYEINIYTNECGLRMCQRNNLDKINYILWVSEKYNKLGIYLAGVMRTLKGILGALKTKISRLNPPCLIYSSSDFWPDSIPAFIMKLKNKNTKWIAGFYLFAPYPWHKDSPYKGKRWFIGLFYWLTQLPIYWIVRKYADMVFVTSEPDVEKFITRTRDRDKIVVVRGGVDTKTPAQVSEPKEKEYGAVFIGRLHPQKGGLELIDIWAKVCQKKRGAKLAIIGEGTLKSEMKEKVKRKGLNSRVVFFGFRDGLEKIRIFKSSKVVLHPAVYDSGGMAACEAMVCSLPGVSFDLPALRTYYPRGMLKTPCFELGNFADNIVALLEDEELYAKTRQKALEWAQEWDWDKKARDILNYMRELFKEKV